jgi:sulfur transfer protein SufE
MSDYPEKLQEVVDTLEFIEDQQERIEFLIDYGEKFKEVPESVASRPFPEANKVEYCESEAYVWTIRKGDGTFDFYFAVENPQGVSAKAFASILQESLSGETAENIMKIDTDLVHKIFGQKLSMGKNMGLSGIILKIQSQVKELANE